MADLQPYLQLLQVSKDATLAELKTAFRRQARACHPDLHPDNPDAETEFRKLSEAYEIVSEALYPVKQNPKFEEFDQSKRGTKAQALYVRATEKTAERDYDGALADYTAAIELEPDFLEAYLKRCQIRYVLGDDVGVLAECSHILKLDDTVAQAYYYQGRARFQLGSPPSAIAAYSQAISLDEEYAPAWLHRGQARLELQETKLARADLQQAVTLFEAQGDREEVHRVQGMLQELTRPPFSRRRSASKFKAKPSSWKQSQPSVWKRFAKDVFTTIPKFFVNPSGGLLPTFARLSPRRALEVGLVYAGMSTLCFLLAANLYPQFFAAIVLWERMVLGIVPFLSLVFMSKLARNFTHTRGSWASDVFIGGATLLPLGLLTFLSGLVIKFGLLVLIIFSVYLICDAILMLYFGCTQINNLSEQSATLAVPTLFLVSGGLTYGIYTVFA